MPQAREVDAHKKSLVSTEIRVALDTTPLLGKPTGVGSYVRSLVKGLADSPAAEPVGYAISPRSVKHLRPRGTGAIPNRAIPFPYLLLMRRWVSSDRPSIDSFLKNPDVVHGTNFVCPPTKHPTVLTVHDLTSVRMPHLCTGPTLMYPALVQKAIDRGAFIHTPTQSVADEVCAEFNVDAERVVAIHHGFELPELQNLAGVEDGSSSETATRDPWGDEYIVAVGTIEPRKNYPRLIEAFSVLARRRKNLHLVIVGPRGWDSERVEEVVKFSGLTGRVHLTGWVDHERRHQIVSGARCLAFVSLYEGFGIPPLEAMALGVPAVVGSAPAISEVCGGAALTVAPSDTVQICDALDLLIDDNAQRNRLIGEGRDRVKHFAWDKAINQTLDLYSKALSV